MSIDINLSIGSSASCYFSSMPSSGDEDEDEDDDDDDYDDDSDSCASQCVYSESEDWDADDIADLDWIFEESIKNE